MKKSILTTAIIAIALIMTSFTTSDVCCKKDKEKNKTLVGMHWELPGVKVEDGEQKPFIYFKEDGQFLGYAGCNRFFGSYFSTKKKVQMNYAGSTKRFCHNMEDEDRFFSVLNQEISHYKIEKDTLFLMKKKEVAIKFVAVDIDTLNVE